MANFLCRSCGTFVGEKERCKCNREWMFIALCYFTITFMVQILVNPSILQTTLFLLIWGAIFLSCYLGFKGKKEDRIQIDSLERSNANDLNSPIIMADEIQSHQTTSQSQVTQSKWNWFWFWRKKNNQTFQLNPQKEDSSEGPFYVSEPPNNYNPPTSLPYDPHPQQRNTNQCIQIKQLYTDTKESQSKPQINQLCKQTYGDDGKRLIYKDPSFEQIDKLLINVEPARLLVGCQQYNIQDKENLKFMIKNKK